MHADGSKSGGRQKGSPNLATGAVKEAIVGAFHEVGGKEWLIRLAGGDRHDRAMFCRMVEKIVPGELKIDPDSQLNLVILRDYTGEHGDGTSPEEGNEASSDSAT